jgi:predicted CoA-binding protein
MATLEAAVDDFLAQRRIAVAGVSRTSGQAANAVYRRLRDRGYEVFAVNPNAEAVEGDRCFPDLASIPGGVDGVVVVTAGAVARSIVEQCAALGISRVWMHRSFGSGSVSEEAATLARDRGMTVIAGGCPLMFDPTADFGHKCMRSFLRVTGRLPREA